MEATWPWIAGPNGMSFAEVRVLEFGQTVGGGRHQAKRRVSRRHDAVSTILDCVESLQPNVLVMGTVSRTDIRGLLIGNTADAVLRRVNCSVLAVKPDGLFRA